VWQVSDLLFPTFRGLTYPITKTPHWNTITQESISGVKKFLQCYTYPYYTFNLSFSYLSDSGFPDIDMRHDDVQTLMAFYNKVGGAGQDFLFADPLFEDNRCANQRFGVGDGTTTQFRLVRQYGSYIEDVYTTGNNPKFSSFTEPVFGINDEPKIYINNTQTDAFSWNKKGLVTFNSAPTSGAILTWTGRWFYRCHFQNDETEFSQIFLGGWELEELVLESIKLE
jgi:uncharacterized protein (TIGR02217 family)